MDPEAIGVVCCLYQMTYKLGLTLITEITHTCLSTHPGALVSQIFSRLHKYRDVVDNINTLSNPSLLFVL